MQCLPLLDLNCNTVVAPPQSHPSLHLQFTPFLPLLLHWPLLQLLWGFPTSTALQVLLTSSVESSPPFTKKTSLGSSSGRNGVNWRWSEGCDWGGATTVLQLRSSSGRHCTQPTGTRVLSVVKIRYRSYGAQLCPDDEYRLMSYAPAVGFSPLSQISKRKRKRLKWEEGGWGGGVGVNLLCSQKWIFYS